MSIIKTENIGVSFGDKSTDLHKTVVVKKGRNSVPG